MPDAKDTPFFEMPSSMCQVYAVQGGCSRFNLITASMTHAILQNPSTGPTPRKPGLLLSLLIYILKAWDRSWMPWYKWPLWTLAPLVYLVLRREALHLNLVEVGQPSDSDLAEKCRKVKVPLSPEDTPMLRTGDAFGNDRANPGAGAYHAAIGRQMAQTPKDARNPMGHPSPQYIAQKLLARKKFVPAGMQLNLMAGAWIQAMIHDWQVCSHLLCEPANEQPSSCTSICALLMSWCACVPTWSCHMCGLRSMRRAKASRKE